MAGSTRFTGSVKDSGCTIIPHSGKVSQERPLSDVYSYWIPGSPEVPISASINGGKCPRCTSEIYTSLICVCDNHLMH